MNSKNYYNFFQPSVIKFSSNAYAEVPESLRNKYALNLNVIGIKYFLDNFLLIEDPEIQGKFMYMLTHDKEKIALDELSAEGTLDVPRAYILLTEQFMESQDAFRDWLTHAIAETSIYATGTEDFKPGRDYYVNQTMHEYLSEFEHQFFNKDDVSFMLPNYLDDEFSMTKWFVDLTEEEMMWNDLDYFYKKNLMQDLTYSEDEFNAFSSTFYNIIRKFTLISNEQKSLSPNPAYNIAIDWFANGKTDAASISLAIIHNTPTTLQVPQTIEGCSCKTTAQGYALNDSCYDIYQQSMKALNEQMLSSTEFYKDWFYVQSLDDLVLNDPLIDALIVLLNEFEALELDLSMSDTALVYNRCCKTTEADIRNIENHKAIKNYIKVLEWIKAGCIDENANKIKIYGQKFAELLNLI